MSSTPTFQDLGLDADLLDVVGELGFTEPTQIQQAAIPALLAGRDLIGRANTGSGKTAAFALPLIQRLDGSFRRVQALVVCPTRELTAQVAREVRTLGRRRDGLQVLVAAGGQPGKPQSEALARGVHVVVGTPGRLLDHLKRGTLDPSDLKLVVLDEADRMLDMGFAEEVGEILEFLPAVRQTGLFSATFPDGIARIARAHLRNPVDIDVAESVEAAPEIRQRVLRVEGDGRLEALYRVLREHEHASALVFCNFKLSVAELGEALREDGVVAAALHGDLDQFQRTEVLARFRNGSLRVLVATDVAGRGIDVEELDLVVNFELPMQPDIYVHRIGRTGRAGRVGVAVSLLTPDDRARLKAIEETIGRPIEAMPRAAAEGFNPDATEPFAEPPPMHTIRVSGGRKDKLRPGDILGALTGAAAGLEAAAVGGIEIHDRVTYVAVRTDVSAAALAGLNTGRIKKRRFRATLL